MRKKTTKEFIIKAKEIHGDKYDYSLVSYINSQTKIKIVCIDHGIFKQTPNNHLKGNKCPKCSGMKENNKDFIILANKIHNNTYNYSLVNYTKAHQKIKIICKEHGIFKQSANNHLRGQRCPKCFGNIKRTNEEFIIEANRIHNYKYNYLLVKYVNSQTKVKIICKKHGIFDQTPVKHLKGRGCYKCGGTKNLTQEEFIKKANIIHNNCYDYSQSKYINLKTKIKIICKYHGIFKQIPNDHLNGNGCSRCSNRKSKIANLWLKSIENNLGYKLIREFRIPNTFIHVDGYDSKTNTIYEFYGDYWHGYPFKYLGINKKLNISFNTLYYKTLAREEFLLKKKYNLITIWENDFYKKREFN